MAWNEPGGSNNKDPWKNRGGNDQGPPDLDDVLKNLFGKFGKGGSSGGGANLSGKGFMYIAIVAIVIYALSGFYTIKEAEKGVLLRFGEFNGLVDPGLNWKLTFIDQVVPVNVQEISSLSSRGAMLTEDENMVSVEMEVQFRVVDPYRWVYAVTDPRTSLSQAFDSAIRYVIGHSTMDDILTGGREVIRARVEEELQAIVAPYEMGVAVVGLNFSNSRPPEEVRAAFDDAIAAQEDQERFIQEAEAYAREREPAARGEVNRINEEAQAYKERIILEAQGEVARFEELLPQFEAAPEVTRQRIYIETMEQVYGNTSKVMVDTQGSGNLMYLPLDKIMQQSNTQSSLQNLTNNRLQEILNDRTNGATRESSSARGSSVRQGRN